MMATAPTLPAENVRLPEKLRPLFWDCRFDDLQWPAHRDFVIGRILVDGPWSAVRWLRQTVGDDAIRTWIGNRKGGALSPQQLRFWELIVSLPHQQVDAWLQDEIRSLWFGRKS